MRMAARPVSTGAVRRQVDGDDPIAIPRVNGDTIPAGHGYREAAREMSVKTTSIPGPGTRTVFPRAMPDAVSAGHDGLAGRILARTGR